MNILTISDGTKSSIRKYIQTKFSGNGKGVYFFRRFNCCISASQTTIINHIGPNASALLHDLSNITEKQIKKNIEIRSTNFFGIVNQKEIRKESTDTSGIKFSVHSKTYKHLDLTSNSDDCFEFTKSLQEDNKCFSEPQKGDLLYLFISNDTINVINSKKSNKNAKYKVDGWCVVSEQFLRFWTLVMYEEHESITKLISKSITGDKRDIAIKEKLFSGNKLMTNSLRKYMLMLEDADEKISVDEMREKFWYLRSENASKKWIDLYTAMILIVKYGEIPCQHNIPNNKIPAGHSTIKNYDRLYWDIPQNFVVSFIFNAIKNTEDIKSVEWVNFAEKVHNQLKVRPRKLQQFCDNSTNTEDQSRDTLPAIIYESQQNDDITWSNIVKNKNT